MEDLCPNFQPQGSELLRQCAQAGVPVAVIFTGRTLIEQADCVRRGTSWTMDSLHLPQRCCGKSHAIDVCPAAYLDKKNWLPGGVLWWKVGKIGEALGLKWGVFRPNKDGVMENVDWGHLEYVERKP
jgi:hypothetical protein